MEIIGVYIIRNVKTGGVYIGSSIHCKRRIGTHRSALRHNRHENSYLQRSWNKNGKENFLFEVVEECRAEDRFIREQWWIDRLQSIDPGLGYNLAHPVQTIVPSPHTSKRMKEMWTDEMRERQAQNNREQYDDPEIKKIRLECLDRGRIKTNAMWHDKSSKVRKVRINNLAKGSAALAELLKDPVWKANRKTGSRTKEVWQRPDYRAKKLVKLKEVQKKGAAAIKKLWDNDPQYRNKILSLKSNNFFLSWQLF
jgi:group I intron endonuclease